MLLTLMTRRLKQERQRVAQLAGARALRDPKNYIDDRRMQLDYTQRRLIAALQRLVAQQRERFVRLTSKLDAMSPLKVLSRGYSMTFDAQGHVVRSVRTLSCGDRITVPARRTAAPLPRCGKYRRMQHEHGIDHI